MNPKRKRMFFAREISITPIGWLFIFIVGLLGNAMLASVLGGNPQLWGLLFSLFLLFVFLCSVRMISCQFTYIRLTQLCMFFVVLSGIVYWWNLYGLAVFFVVIPLLVWMLAELPAWLFVLLILELVVSIFSTWITKKPSGEFPNPLLSDPNRSLYLIFGQFLIVMFLLSLYYFPRRLQFKRYFWPKSEAKPFYMPVRRDSGFTLIELLIVVAIIGIMTGGTLQVWNGCMRIQYDLDQRVKIAQILSSEMDAILSQTGTFTVSDQPQPLPLALDSFSPPKSLTGDCLVEAGDTPGLVRITIRLIHGPEPETQQHYRLVAYHRQEP